MPIITKKSVTTQSIKSTRVKRALNNFDEILSDLKGPQILAFQAAVEKRFADLLRVRSGLPLIIGIKNLNIPTGPRQS
jgi:hypothetical protein